MVEAKRRLAAILAADVAGYSRLMGDDEAATVRTLNDYRGVFADHIARHGGRLVDSPGDALMAEFPSAVEAVQYALDIQVELARRNRQLADHRRMELRIGVNLGDVIAQDDGTLYGDGVNIAARLEALAEPGELCISGTVFDHVEGKLDAQFKFAGEQKVKNIGRPIRVYTVSSGDGESITRQPWYTRRPVAALAAAVLLILSGGLAWQTWDQLDHEPDNGDAVLDMPTGPTVAVLPFDNMSGDPDQAYFSDGLTEEIIAALSRFRDLRVLARNSTFRYKRQLIDIREIGRELDADYIIEGSVRRSADTVRVTVQLIDAYSGTHIWAESYDRALTVANLFEVQDQITERIVATLADSYGVIARTTFAETRSKGAEDLEAYECVLRAYEHWRRLSPETHRRARACLEQTVKKDPDYAEAWAWLAMLYRQEHAHGFNPQSKEHDPLAKALEAAQRAVELDPTSQAAHHALADAYFFRKNLDA